MTKRILPLIALGTVFVMAAASANTSVFDNIIDNGTLTTSGNVRFSAYTSGAALFNGSGLLSSVAPGASGNLFTSNGSTWTSASPPSSGVTSLGAFGSSPNGNAGTIAGSVLTLQPADATNPGGVSTTTQTLAGTKIFSSPVQTDGYYSASGVKMMDHSGGINALYTFSGGTWVIPDLGIIEDSNGNHVINFSNGLNTLIDKSNFLSVDWFNRTLSDSAGSTLLSWNSSPVAVTGGLTATGSLTTGSVGVTSGKVVFNGSTSSSVSVVSSAAAGNWTLTLPPNTGTSGQFLQTNGSGVSTWVTGNSGTVTSLSVASANGFAGSFTASATPVLTLTTTINAPALAGNGTAISAATTTGSGSTVVLATGPTMTNPVVGTQAPGDNTTLAASTAFVTAAVSGAGGGCVTPVLTKTTSYVVLTADFTCANKILMVEINCTAACTLTFPAASNTGFTIKAINVGTGVATIATAGSDTFGSTADTTWFLNPLGDPQSSNEFTANGGTRWNGF